MLPVPAPPASVLPPDADDALLLRTWLHGKAPGTVEGYRRDVRTLMIRIPEGLRTLTLPQLQHWADALAPLAPATRARRIAAVKSLLTFAFNVGYLPYNIGRGLRIPKRTRSLAARILPESAVQRMIHRAPHPRDHALLLTLYATGARVSEMTRLTWKDLRKRENGGQLTLCGKGSRTREVPVPPAVWNALTALRQATPHPQPQNHVWQGARGPLTRKGIWDIVRRAAKRAELEENPSPHWLRHTAASHALDRGAPIHVVQSTLGHRSLTTTSQYVHARPQDAIGNYLVL